MTRQEAKDLLFKNIQQENLRKHHLATEAAMRAFATRFGKDEEIWGLVGLLHDMDWEKTKDNPENHTKVALEILQPYNLSEEVLNGIKAHHPAASGKTPETLMEKTMFYTEELTGLIIAAALVQPDKKLASVKVDSVMRKLKDKSFARGVDRELVYKSAEVLDLPLKDIIETVLKAMQGISSELGL